MGTRALVKIKCNKTTILGLYRQYDGYPTGLGQDILDVLNKGAVTLRNGYGAHDEIPTHFNGMPCLAAYLVGKLKNDKIGNVYVTKPNDKNVGEEYVYTLYEKHNLVYLKVKAYNKIVYNGPLHTFDPELTEKKLDEYE